MPNSKIGRRDLMEVRKKVEREMYIRKGLFQSILTILVLWTLYSICFSNRDGRSYNLHASITNSIINPPSIDRPKFHKIQTMEDYIRWVYNTAFPALFPEKDYTGELLHWRWRQYYSDLSSFRVGPPRLRQIRVKTEKDDQILAKNVTIYPPYYVTNENTDDHCFNWKHFPCDQTNETYSFSTRGWKYTSALDVWGVPIVGRRAIYSGGGYIAELDVNLDFSNRTMDELNKYFWFDRQTRSVFFEFTLYSANLNMFSYVILTAEFLETGGVVTMSSIYPLRIYQHHGSTGVYIMFCEGLFLIILLFMTLKVLYNLYRIRWTFFGDNTRVLDLLCVLQGLVSVAMYIGRLLLANDTMNAFKADSKRFLEFQHIATWDLLFSTVLGCLLFTWTVRLLSILDYDKRFGEALAVLRNRVKDLFWFGMLLLYGLSVFATVGYLLFGKTLTDYMNIFASFETLFISLVGKNSLKKLAENNPILAQIFFSSYIFFMVYVMLTTFLAILGDSISNERTSNKNKQTEGIVEYIISSFRNMFNTGHKAPEKEKPALVTISDVFYDLTVDIHRIVDKMGERSLNQSTSQETL